MEYVVELKNLNKGYVDNKGHRVEVLKNMTLKFEKGKMYGIMGVSGAGKSTLLSVIGLLDGFEDGNLLISGKEANDLSENQRADMRKQKIGFIFQNYYLNPKLNVEDNLILALRINKNISRTQYHSRVQELLSQFGMNDFAKRYPTELSGGEQQRVCIARAMANEPELILADEPTGSLDRKNEAIVMEYLKELTQKGKTVIVVSHSDIIKDYAHEMVYLEKDGKYAVG